MQTFQGIRVAAMSFPPGLCSREDDDAAFASSTTYGCDPDYPWSAAESYPACRSIRAVNSRTGPSSSTTSTVGIMPFWGGVLQCYGAEPGPARGVLGHYPTNSRASRPDSVQ
jgi:hypothetical protein